MGRKRHTEDEAGQEERQQANSEECVPYSSQQSSKLLSLHRMRWVSRLSLGKLGAKETHHCIRPEHLPSGCWNLEMA